MEQKTWEIAPERANSSRFSAWTKSRRWFTRPIAFIASSKVCKTKRRSETLLRDDRHAVSHPISFRRECERSGSDENSTFLSLPGKTCLHALLDGLVKAECVKKIYFDHEGGWIVASARTRLVFLASLPVEFVFYVSSFLRVRFSANFPMNIYVYTRGLYSAKRVRRDWIRIIVEIGRKRKMQFPWKCFINVAIYFC